MQKTQLIDFMQVHVDTEFDVTWANISWIVCIQMIFFCAVVVSFKITHNILIE